MDEPVLVRRLKTTARLRENLDHAPSPSLAVIS